MKRILLYIFFTIFSISPLLAQEDYDFVERRNPWNQGYNVAGIRLDTLSKSVAEIYFAKENGGLVDYSASDDSWTVGAYTESIRHLKKISFKGRFEYQHFSGDNMCGSMFIHPGYYPVDILEFTPGRKLMDVYQFEGGLSTPIAKHWTLGLEIDFTATNIAKRKDLRHKNTRLDMEVKPSILFHAGDWKVGFTYRYLKNDERINPKEVGTSSTSYDAFFNKGLGYGLLEKWDGNGIHLKETGTGVIGFPIGEQNHGAALQLAYKNLFGEIYFGNRKGDSGEKATFWHDFKTTDVNARIVWRIDPKSYRHFLRMNINWAKIQNRENQFTVESIDGISTPVYHGSTLIYSGREMNLGLEYEFHKERWNLQTGFGWWRKEEQSTLYYPYSKSLRLNQYSFYVQSEVSLGKWKLQGRLNFQKGNYTDWENNWEPSLEAGEYPQQLTSYYQYTNEYLTASRLGAGMSLKRYIKNFHIALDADYEHGFGLKYVRQPNHIRAALRVGYNF